MNEGLKEFMDSFKEVFGEESISEPDTEAFLISFDDFIEFVNSMAGLSLEQREAKLSEINDSKE